MVVALVGRDGGTDRGAQRATKNRAIPATDLVADGGARCATDTAADGRIQGRVVCIGLEGESYGREEEKVSFHSESAV